MSKAIETHILGSKLVPTNGIGVAQATLIKNIQKEFKEGASEKTLRKIFSRLEKDGILVKEIKSRKVFWSRSRNLIDDMIDEMTIPKKKNPKKSLVDKLRGASKKYDEKLEAKRKLKEAKSIKKVGVIDTIVKTCKEKPVTKKEILAALVKAFPDRVPEKMRKTIDLQVPRKLRLVRNIKWTIEKTGHGREKTYYIAPSSIKKKGGKK